MKERRKVIKGERGREEGRKEINYRTWSSLYLLSKSKRKTSMNHLQYYYTPLFFALFIFPSTQHSALSPLTIRCKTHENGRMNYLKYLFHFASALATLISNLWK